MVSEDSINPPVNLDCRGNQAVSSYRGFPVRSKDAPNILRRECKSQGPDDSVLKLANKRHVDGGRENNMGRTLKHQAQLIDHYETMKKAQRELEHKVRGNNSSKQIMQESWDMGYHYDVTKERDEGNALHLWSARKVTSSGQEDGSKPNRVYLSNEMLKAKSGDNHQDGKTIGSSAFHGQESSLASNKNSLYELNSNEQPHEISGVLESLKQAKISLQQKINSGTTIQTSSLVSRSEGSGMTVGSSSLFRLPADFSDDSTARYNARDSNFQFGLNAYPGRDTSINFYGNLGTNPYPGTMLTSADDRSLANRYMGTGSTFDTTRIPPNFSEEAYARFNSVDSTPVSSPNSSPGRGISGTSGGQCPTNPYPGIMLTSADDRSLANRYMGTGSTFDPTRIPPHLSEEAYARFNSLDSTPVSSPNSSPGRGFSGTMLTSEDDESPANRYMRPRPVFDPSTLPPNFCEEVYARFNAVDSTPESSPNNSPGRRISGTKGGQCSTIPSDDGSMSAMETGLRRDTEGSSVVPLHLSSGRYMDPPTFPISPSYENATHRLPIVW